MTNVENSFYQYNRPINLARFCFYCGRTSITLITFLFADRIQKQYMKESSLALHRSEKPLPIISGERTKEIHFLIPNEFPVQPKLADIKKGWIVSTGTERSLFNLILAPNHCEGVIIRDVDEQVKNYIDCVVLLLKISENRNEFVQTIQNLLFSDKDIQTELKICYDKLRESAIPEQMKEFYINRILSNPTFISTLRKAISLSKLGASYTKSKQLLWSAHPEFKAVNYHRYDALFNKLQKYAKQGRIIATLGDIADLSPFRDLKIAAIDISNICDYTPCLDVHSEGSPRIIWTIGANTSSTQYFSGELDPLTDGEKEELTSLLKQFHLARNCFVKREMQTLFSMGALEQEKTYDIRKRCKQIQETSSLTPTMPFPCYSRYTLEILRQYAEKNLVSIPDACIDFGDSLAPLNELSESQLQQFIDHPKTARFLPEIAHMRNLWKIPYLKHEVFFAFMQIDGWKEAFLSQFDADGYTQVGSKKIHAAVFISQLPKEIAAPILPLLEQVDKSCAKS